MIDIKIVNIWLKNVHGRKHIWFSSGCPNNPELRINLLNKVKDVDEIILDGIRLLLFEVV